MAISSFIPTSLMIFSKNSDSSCCAGGKRENRYKQYHGFSYIDIGKPGQLIYQQTGDNYVYV